MGAQHFTVDDFDEKVLKADTPAMIDFYAEWCGPCQMAAPIIDELSDEYAGKVIVGKVNVDENQELAGRFGVMSIPTVIAFKGGEEAERKIGFAGKQGYVDILEKLS